MKETIYNNYLNILKAELVPALGCTEPIAIAYAAAKARQVLGCFPEHMEMHCSGNIIKNVKGVTVPNSGGLKGIDVAAILGAIGGNADKALEVLEGITADHIDQAKEMASHHMCDCFLVEDVANLYIVAKVMAEGHSAEVTIVDTHTNITKIVKDGEVIYENSEEVKKREETIDRSLLTVKDILDFANRVKMEDIEEVIGRQVK